jgi:hypothetical protein
MDHSDIERENLVERYVRGTMPPAERSLFEEHFVDCAGCLEQLEAARGLRQALRESAARPVASPVPRAPRRAAWQWVAAVAMACLLLAVVAAGNWRRQLLRSRDELAAAQAALARATADARQLDLPPSVHLLALSRGAADVSEIPLPPDHRWIVFSIALDTSRYQVFEAVLENQRGQVAWQGNGLRPFSPDSLAAAVPSRLLAPGAYTLTIRPAGVNDPLARFPLHMTSVK